MLAFDERQVVSDLAEARGGVGEDAVPFDFLLEHFGENDLEAEADALLVQVPGQRTSGSAGSS